MSCFSSICQIWFSRSYASRASSDFSTLIRSSSSSAESQFDACVVLAAEVQLDVVLQVRIDDLRRQLRILRVEAHFD